MLHDAETLNAIAEHVAYEMWMLHATTRLTETGRFPPESADFATKTIGNALLESSLVHLRSLDDFLGSKRGPKARRLARLLDWARGRHRTWRDDDVIARDYLETWKPRKILNAKERRAINKRLAHINTERTQGRLVWRLQRSHDGYAACLDFLKELQAADADHFHVQFKKVLLWFSSADGAQ